MTKYIKRTEFNRKYPGRKNRDLPAVNYIAVQTSVIKHLRYPSPMTWRGAQDLVVKELDRVIQHDWTIRRDPRCSGISGGGSAITDELITFTNHSDYDLVRLLYL